MAKQKLYNGLVYKVGTNVFYVAKSSIEESDVPAIGDTVVRIGNATNTDRQGALYLTSSDDGAPYLDVLAGVDSPDFSGKTVVRIGRQDGIIDDVFGKLEGFGGYFQNIYARGVFNLADGTDVMNRFEVGEGLFSSLIESIAVQFSDFETLIEQTDNSILLEALRSDYNNLDQLVAAADAKIAINANDITSMVTITTFDALTGEVDTLSAEQIIQAGLIENKVSNSDFVSTFAQYADEIDMSAVNINLSGIVGFTAFETTVNDVVSATEQLSQDLTNLDLEIATTFRDGIIEESEAIAISKLIVQIEAIFQDTEAEFDSIWQNTLFSDVNDVLVLAFISIIETRETLIYTINTAIADSRTTAAESTAVDNAYTDFTASLGEFRTAIASAVDSIREESRKLAVTEAEENINSSLGELAWESAIGFAKLDETIIDGGYLKTSLINADALLVGKFSSNLAIRSNEAISYDGSYMFAGYDLVGGDVEKGAAYTAVYNVTFTPISTSHRLMAYIGGNNHICSHVGSIANETFVKQRTITDIDYGRDQLRFYIYDESTGNTHPISGTTCTVHWCALYKGDVAASDTEWRPSEVEAGGVVFIADGKINADLITAVGAVTAGSFNLGNGKFVVDTDGNFTSNNARITGVMQRNVSYQKPTTEQGLWSITRERLELYDYFYIDYSVATNDVYLNLPHGDDLDGREIFIVIKTGSCYIRLALARYSRSGESFYRPRIFLNGDTEYHTGTDNTQSYKLIYMKEVDATEGYGELGAWVMVANN